MTGPADASGSRERATGPPIVVLDGYPLDAGQRARLEAVSSRYRFIHQPIDDQATIDVFDGSTVEVLLAEYVPLDLAAWPRLRWVQYSGAGVDPLGEQAPWRQGVIVTTASGGNAIPIGEYVLGWLLHHSQQIDELLENQRRRTWASTRLSLGGHGLRGKTVTLIGYGSVGREVARLAQPFGVRILAVKARPDERLDNGFRFPGTGDPDGLIPERIVGLERLPDVVAQADYVVVAAPSTAASRGALGAAILAALPPRAWLINVGRGDIFEEPALVDALRARPSGGAILDVTAVEPLDARSQLWSLPNVIVTPHVAGLQPDTWASLTELFCQNLGRWVAGEALLNPVDPERGY